MGWLSALFSAVHEMGLGWNASVKVTRTLACSKFETPALYLFVLCSRYIICLTLLAFAGFQARSKDQEILEEGGGAGPSLLPRRDHE